MRTEGRIRYRTIRANKKKGSRETDNDNDKEWRSIGASTTEFIICSDICISHKADREGIEVIHLRAFATEASSQGKILGLSV